MDRYKCNRCKKTFRYYETSNSESVLVRKVSARCPMCNSYHIGLTEHGKLLVERQKKLSQLDKNSKYKS